MTVFEILALFFDILSSFFALNPLSPFLYREKVSLLKVPTKQGFAKMKSALTFETLAKCSTTKARVSILTLPHGPVDTPVFMPVGTQGTMKGMLPDQLEALNCQIMLNNTYHLVRVSPFYCDNFSLC